MPRRNNTHKQLLYIFLFILFFSCIPHVHTQEVGLVIDVSSPIIESHTNFSVSVYEPTIQQGTPYLVNVTILFNDKYYQITPEHENSEIILTAPKVLINTSYLIQAFAQGKTTNTSITIIPLQHPLYYELVITLDSYTIHAYDEFGLIVTDKNGQPIENTTISIYQNNIFKSSTLTDTKGYALLKAPNVEYIEIIASKHGYFNTTESLYIQQQHDTFNKLLYHPYTPIFISLIVLISIILYVSLQNIKTKNQFFFKKHSKKNKHHMEKEKLSKTPPIKKDISIDNKIPKKKNIPISSQSKSQSTFSWFHPKQKSQTNHNINSSRPQNTIDDIHSKIDAMQDKKEKNNK